MKSARNHQIPFFFCIFALSKWITNAMSNDCHTPLNFHKLTLADRDSLQAISLASGRRNCNYTFANLICWQFWFNTEVCLCENTAILRFNIEERRAYMVCSAVPPSLRLLELLCADAASLGTDLQIMGVEDEMAAHIQSLMPGGVTVEPCRNQYDYIYLRQELAELKGKNLKAKRNHVNKFLSEHPRYEYVELTPERFDECRQLSMLWRNEVHQDTPFYSETVKAEQRSMENALANWDELKMIGGCVYDGSRLLAFTYGSAVTHDTFDVCVEKADRQVDGAFNIINQQFASHLPEQYIYLNREEDMGLEGLRKSKLSYHPYQLLSYNIVNIQCP